VNVQRDGRQTASGFFEDAPRRAASSFVFIAHASELSRQNLLIEMM